MSNARAYDAVADDYDRLVEKDLGMRRVLWRHYARRFRAGDRVIDVGCGTGADALFLARRGVRVTALDVSPRMIAVLRAKAKGLALDGLIDARVQDAAELSSLPAGTADGIISAFAALNAVGDLAAFAAAAQRVLRPRGRLLAHLLGPRGLRGAECEPNGDGTRTIVVCGEPVRHILLPAGEVYRRFFSPRFQLLQSYGLGFIWPWGLDERLPAAIAAALGRVGYRLGRFPPFLDWSRFFVLDMRLRP